jgi:hypothetical protein
VVTVKYRFDSETRLNKEYESTLSYCQGTILDKKEFMITMDGGGGLSTSRWEPSADGDGGRMGVGGTAEREGDGGGNNNSRWRTVMSVRLRWGSVELCVQT